MIRLRLSLAAILIVVVAVALSIVSSQSPDTLLHPLDALKGEGPTKLDRIVDDGPRWWITGSTAVEINQMVKLHATSDPPSQTFKSGEPVWAILSRPEGSRATLTEGGISVAMTPDLPGTYMIRATAGGVSNDFEIGAIKFVRESLGPDVQGVDPGDF